MIKIHTSDGQTIPIDLNDEDQAREWIDRMGSRPFQESIRGVSLVLNHAVSAKCMVCRHPISRSIGVQYSISRPQAFRSVQYEIENVPEDGAVKGGERIVVYADEARISLMAHKSQPSARVIITKPGKRRYRP